MKKKITEKQLFELELIKDWCLTILIFITDKSNNNPIINQMKDVIINSYNNQNIKELINCKSDIIEWIKGFSQNDTEELNNLLRDKFGNDLVIESNNIIRKIKYIIKKGKITNDNEYRLLLSRVDEIYQNDSKQMELKKLNKLLANYHKFN